MTSRVRIAKPHRLAALAVPANDFTLRTHPLDASRERRQFGLGEICGLAQTAVHLVRLAPGATSTVQHWHASDDEWLYILEAPGSGAVLLVQEGLDGETRAEPVRDGDFYGFPAGVPNAHALRAGDEEILYLVGGTRGALDVSIYTEQGGLSKVSGPSHGAWVVTNSAKTIKSDPPPSPPPRPYRIRPLELPLADFLFIAHPADPRASEHKLALDGATGLTQLGVHLARVAADTPSAALHWHVGDEDWFFILESSPGSVLRIRAPEDGDTTREEPVARGDFLAFPAGSRAARAFRAGDGELVYLAGGSRGRLEVCFYPEVGLAAVFDMITNTMWKTDAAALMEMK
jgi:uncharacterized cupin superfamily protein